MMSAIHNIITKTNDKTIFEFDGTNVNNEDEVEPKGIYFMEHMNLVVGNRKKAETFYCDGLGFKLDPIKINTNVSFHINLGQHQFHLVEEGAEDYSGHGLPGIKTNKIFGNIGIVVPSVMNVCEKLDNLHFRYERLYPHGAVEQNQKRRAEEQPHNEHAFTSIRVTCPWNNVFYVYGLKENKTWFEIKMPTQLTNMNHLRFQNPVGVRGMMPGIRFFEFYVDKGKAKRIGNFYQKFLGCIVRTGSAITKGDIDNFAVVEVGPNIHLAFSEVDNHSGSYNNSGIHIAIYIDKFKDRYTLFKEHNLIWTNPRFVKEDTCNTFQEACTNRQFRFKNIIDPETGEVLFELEHETRSLRHFQFMKQVAY